MTPKRFKEHNQELKESELTVAKDLSTCETHQNSLDPQKPLSGNRGTRKPGHNSDHIRLKLFSPLLFCLEVGASPVAWRWSGLKPRLCQEGRHRCGSVSRGDLEQGAAGRTRGGFCLEVKSVYLAVSGD